MKKENESNEKEALQTTQKNVQIPWIEAQVKVLKALTDDEKSCPVSC